jgi:hypothetical protein
MQGVMAVDDTRQRLQRELEDAYRRGQLDETVRSVQSRLSEITDSIREMQVSMAELTKSSVSMKRFEALEVTVTGLDRWKWKIIGVVGGLVALLQVIPMLWKLMKG